MEDSSSYEKQRRNIIYMLFGYVYIYTCIYIYISIHKLCLIYVLSYLAIFFY